MIKVLIHILNEDPVVGEVEEIPSAQTLNIAVHHPRLRDGKPLSYLERDVTVVIWPMHRINFVEVYPDDEEEDIISHVRE